jgi:hypothetical protein
MIASYSLRLVCLSLAVLLMVHMLVGLAVSLLGPMAVRVAERMRPRNAARLLMILRLLPASAAAFVVGVLCVPSYLSLEQEAGGEEIGWLCITAALASAILLASSIINLGRTAARSARYARYCERTGAPVMMLTGILRPRLVVSDAVRRALSAEQLEAALRHEQAHRHAWDNLKRLLLAGTPRMPGFSALERGWSRLSEWAADDEAVAGDAGRALCLADALVRVARLGTVPVEVSFLGDGQDLARRVDRLLNPHTYGPPQTGTLAAAAAVGLAVFAALTMLTQPLSAAHQLFEHLVH